MGLTQQIDLSGISINMLLPYSNNSLEIGPTTFQKKSFEKIIDGESRPLNYPIVKKIDGVDYHFRISNLKIDKNTGNLMFEIFKYGKKGSESIGGLIFEEVNKNIYYISGLEIEDDYFKRIGLGNELMNSFKNYLGEDGMGFLSDSTSNYGIKSPYKKYGWNKEKFIPELKQRKVMYYGNNTREKKVQLKQAVQNFYKNN